jgi:uncharacterized OsmC-like protein
MTSERTMKATIESAGGVASRVRIGNHELTFDQPAPVPGGEDHGPSPLDVMAFAVGACAHYYAAAFLFGRKLSADGLRVEVEYDKVRDPVPRIGRLSMRVILPSSVPPQHHQGIERAVRHCPAYGTLTHPPEVVLEIEHEPVRASTPAA